MTPEKDRLHKAADEYANSIAQHDERKTYCVEDFIAGAKWADKTMIDKACEWLYEYCRYGCCEYIEKNDFIEDFRKAMED